MTKEKEMIPGRWEVCKKIFQDSKTDGLLKQGLTPYPDCQSKLTDSRKILPKKITKIWGKIYSGFRFLSIPGIIALIVLIINFVTVICCNDSTYATFLLAVGDYSAFYGICANVSVTFIALLFAIASINISLKKAKKGSNIGSSATDGAYGLKLLIKEDLIRVSLCTIILQLGLLLLNHVIPTINFLHFPLMTFTIVLMIYSLWFTINSVYYSIVQNNVNPILQDNLLNIGGDVDGLWDYPHARYDVYTVKKTLYPSLYKLLLHEKGNQIQSSRIVNDYHKLHLIEAWNASFYEVLKAARYNVFDLSKQKNKSYLQTLKEYVVIDKYCMNYFNLFKLSLFIVQKQNNDSYLQKLKENNNSHNCSVKYFNLLKYGVFVFSKQNNDPYLQMLKEDADNHKYCMKYFELFKPKIQAPDWVVEICLDYEEQYRNEREELFESLLFLLHCCKLYIEDRQDERKVKHLWINRSRYKNLNDTFMYTLYGNLLSHLSSCIGDDDKKLYYDEAKEMYNLALAINFENVVAQHNSEIIDKELEYLNKSLYK